MAGSASRRISPELVVAAGCAIALITAGPRATAGLFQIPMTTEYGWGRDVFGLAIALQNLLWGVGQPFAGAVADRFGAVRVICAGAMLYALGLVGHGLCGDARAAASRRRRAHRLRPLGLARSTSSSAPSASSCRREWRPLAFGAGTAAGSLGQFFFPPIANLLIDGFGWHQALVVFAVTVLVAMPFSLVLARRGDALGGGPAAAARPVDPAGARRGLPAPQLRAARARLLHLRLPARLHHRASAGLSSRTPGFRPRSAAGRSP